MIRRAFLKILPPDVNVIFDLAYASEEASQSLALRKIDLNAFVDSVLQTIFDASGLLEPPFSRRKIAFTSFSPDVCSALNWKQPNCKLFFETCAIKNNLLIFPDPTFFGCICGKTGDDLPSATSLGSGQGEKRVSSVGAAVEFAKANNMLGLFVDASLLVRSSCFFCEHLLKKSYRPRFRRWWTAFGVLNFLLVYMGLRGSGSV